MHLWIGGARIAVGGGFIVMRVVGCGVSLAMFFVSAGFEVVV